MPVNTSVILNQSYVDLPAARLNVLDGHAKKDGRLSIDFSEYCGSCKLTGRIIGNSHCLWI